MTVSLTDARSTELYARALQRLPGGVNSPVRAMKAIGRDPVFVERGHGAELFDVDGNRYVDYVCSWGPLIHGHAHPEILAAVMTAAERGTTFGAPTQGEVELADEVIRTISTDGTRRAISSARSTSPWVGAPKVVPRSPAATTAAITAGWAWPWMSGPHEQT